MYRNNSKHYTAAILITHCNRSTINVLISVCLPVCLYHTNAKSTEYLSTSDIFSMYTLDKEATIHQLTTMLSTSKNVQFPGHNHLLATGADDPIITRA